MKPRKTKTWTTINVDMNIEWEELTLAQTQAILQSYLDTTNVNNWTKNALFIVMNEIVKKLINKKNSSDIKYSIKFGQNQFLVDLSTNEKKLIKKTELWYWDEQNSTITIVLDSESWSRIDWNSSSCNWRMSVEIRSITENNDSDIALPLFNVLQFNDFTKYNSLYFRNLSVNNDFSESYWWWILTVLSIDYTLLRKFNEV